MAGKTTPTVMDIRPRKVADAVGAGIPRRDAPEKARGEAQYVADMRRPNMLFGKAVRSPYPHARVKKIDATRALAHPGVVSVLTARDIPGKNVTGARAVKDQPVLAPGVVMFTGEAVALVVAETEPAAREGAKLVRVSYEPLPVVDDPENALVPGSPLLREKSNLCHEFKIIRGDFEAARKQADFEITRTYRTQMVDHSALEPDSSLAEPDGDGLQVWVSSKGVHVDQGEVARVLGLPLQKIRVVAATIGGSFGSKPDLPTVCMAALITLKTGRPAKVTLTREECFLAKTKRHPYVFKYTYAVRRDGKILGAQVDAIADAGAYASFTPTVITKGLIHATGPYVVPNVHLTVRAAFTNNPVTGAMRGYGEPQYTFAVERHMDVIARQLDLDPWELRMRNAFRQGDLTITGQRLIHAPMLELLEASRRRVRELDELDRAEGRLEKNVRYQRAWGIAACHSGLGRTGVADNAEVTLRLEPDGVFHLFVGCPDTGQGSDTGMVQIAAQELGVPLDLVRITSADTFLTRDAGTTTATRVTYIVGSAVQQAAKELRARLLGAAESKEGFGVASLEHDRRWLADLENFCSSHDIKVECVGSFVADSSELDENGQGNPYGAYTFGLQWTRVRVDTWTWKIDVERIVSCFDVGRAINPMLLEGQLQGGIVMALGYSLIEEVVLNQGCITNPNFDRYLLPTAADVPPITLMVLEPNDPGGPFGAKGIGEPSTVPGAASVANAVAAAVEVDLQEIPITPERLCALAVAEKRRAMEM